MVVCAAKSYLTQYGIPEKPADLSSHSWLEYSVRPDNEFELIAPEGISTRLIPQGRFVTNDPMTLVRWLTAGAGIAYVPLMWVINESIVGSWRSCCRVTSQIHARFMRYIPKKISCR